MIRKDFPKLGEHYFEQRLANGLLVRVIEKPGFAKRYAFVATDYGSIDAEFILDGKKYTTPQGVAHYLEHKMFDLPEGNAMQEFAKYAGANNAFTSYTMTAYYVECTEHLEENLEILLRMVTTGYFTEESVQKEQGIIGQEIRMYDDSGSWKLFFNFLNCLYKEHPVKKEIAGTVESISHITPEYLYKCYDTFYNLSNMSIVVVGNVDPVKISKVIENGVKKNEPFEEKIKKVYPTEPDEVAKQYAEQSLSVAMPLFMTGFKDTNNGFGGDELLKKRNEYYFKNAFRKKFKVL